MATITPVNRAVTTAQVSTLTVVSGSDTTTYKATIGGKVASYTAAGGNNAATIAAGLLAAIEALQEDEPEWQEVTAADSGGGVLTVTGPDDGTPFTMTATTTGGAGTLTAATPTPASSPYHANQTANYSGGALPTNGDTLVLEGGSVPFKWELDALTAVAYTLVRRATYTGGVGLPPTNANGYPEYRPRYLECAGTAITWEQGRSDAAGQFRVRSTAASAVTATVTGSGASRGPGQESLELYGLPADSVVRVGGAAVALAPLQGQTASAVEVLADAGAVVRCGPGLTLGDVSATGSQVQLACDYGTLTLDRGARATVSGAAGGDEVALPDGTLTWQSTGNPGALDLGAAGVFDANGAPAEFEVTSVTAVKGSTIRDRAGRIERPWDLVCDGCALGDVRLETAANLTVTVGVGP